MKKVRTIVIIGLSVLFGFFVYRYIHFGHERSLQAKQASEPVVPDAPPLLSPRTPPAGEAEFRNEFYRFQLFYPENAVVTVTKEKESAATITFETATSSFQIFVVPYGDAQISKARFMSDEPSGVIDQKTDIVIDGKPAIMFFGKNDVLGETREVWFIASGFLYEVTTTKDKDVWLSEIMKTWQTL